LGRHPLPALVENAQPDHCRFTKFRRFDVIADQAATVYLAAVAILALWVGIWCYFVPGHSDEAIPWRVWPLCAAFLGAMYLLGAVFCGGGMLARRWVEARALLPMIAIWTGGLTILSTNLYIGLGGLRLPLPSVDGQVIWREVLRSTLARRAMGRAAESSRQ
jgi:hypothetical protein